MAIHKYLSALGATCESYSLNGALPKELRESSAPATLLIVRDGITTLMGIANREGLIAEVKGTSEVVDKQVWMRGAVKNKHARWNLCFADTASEPNYPAKQGRVVAFSSMPYLAVLRSQLRKCVECATGRKDRLPILNAELNYYYDLTKTGIGFHGDTERRIVIGVRFGSSMNLLYQWYSKWQPVSPRAEFILQEGDLYLMSEKAVGTDWKSSSGLTLRHAAGAEKYTK